MTNDAKSRLVQLATYASVSVAFVIICIKIIAWIQTDSLSLLSSLIDSVLDIAVSLLNLFAVRYALMPADEDHRFGHGKAEDVAAMLQSFCIGLSSLFIFSEAVSRISQPVVVQETHVGMIVMGLSTFLTVMLVLFQRYVVSKTKSVVIAADALHYKVDIFTSLVVFGSLYFSSAYDNPYIDVLIAVGIAAYILKGAWEIGSQSFDHLMDKEFDEAIRKQIMEKALGHDMVIGVHDLRTRRSGVKPFVQLHLELDGNITLYQAHDISEAVEASILELFDDAEVLIHQDPAVIKNIPLEKGQVLSTKGKGRKISERRES